MPVRARARFVALSLFALCLLAASVAFWTTSGAASPSAAQPREQLQSTPEQEEPPGEEAQGEPEEGTEEVEGNDVEEEVTPPPLEPPPAAPAPSPTPAPPPTPIVVAPVTPPVAPPPVAPPAPQPDAASASKAPDAVPPTPAVEPPGAPAATATATTPPSSKGAPGELSANLRKICARLGTSPLANDPIAAAFLTRMNSGQSSADEMDDFGVYLARKTYLGDGEAFVKAAVERDKRNTDYWLNLGTIRLQRNKLSSALTAYEKALDLDPNRAVTHYDIGVVHDYMRNYDRAVDSFTRALAIDPSLGDPKKNPLAVNNDRLLVVNLLLYQAKEGGLAMPLLGGPEVVPPPKPRPVESKKSGS